MKDDLFEVDARLLVRRYGKKRVLDFFLQQEAEYSGHFKPLRVGEQEPKKSRSKKAPHSLADIASTEFSERPDIADLARTLAINYEKGTFLPNLRDVRRFLDRVGGQSRMFKSRAAAGPTLLRALSQLTRDEVVALTAQHEEADESDYALLSRAIMGSKPTESQRVRRR